MTARFSGIAVVVLLVAVLGGAIVYSLWPQADDASALDPETGRGSQERQKSLAERVEALEQQRLSFADAGVTRVTGLVQTGDGQPVANADVWVTVSGGVDLLEALTCETCGAALYECAAPASARELVALARAGKLRPKVLASTKTDATGRFTLDGVPAAELEIRARDRGAGEGFIEVDLAATEEPEDGPEQLVVQLLPRTSVTVTVVDPDEKPVSGAVVTIFDRLSGTVSDSVSNERGEISAPGGGMWVLVEATGFLPQVLHDFYVMNEPYGDGQLERAMIRLDRPHRLRVETRLSGQLVEATVEVTGLDHPRRQVGKGGIALFESLPRGTIEVKASYQTYVSPKQFVEIEGDPVVRVDLRPASRLSVAVLDEKGEPVHDARVSVDGYGNSDLQTTDDTGAVLVFDHLAEGAYQVHVEANGLRDAQRRVDLKPGDNHLDVTLQKASLLTGKVVDASGQPVGSATVELVSQIHEAVTTSTSDDGSFELQVDEPGAYRLRAREPQLGQVIASVNAPAEAIVLKLEPMARIEVRVLADRNPVKGAYVSVFGTGAAADDSGTAVSDERGLARLAGLQGGAYMVHVEQSGFQRVEPRPLKLQPNSRAELTILLEHGVEIVGRVVDEGGRPVPNADVHTVDPTPPIEGKELPIVPGGAFSDENGEFHLEGLKPGQEYALAATTDARATKAPVKLKAPASGVTIKLELLPSVKGRVIDEAGSPVLWFRVDGHEFETADGRFSVAREPDSAGKIYMNVDANGYETLGVERELTPDLGDLRLKKSPLVRGVVVDASGQPVSGADVTCDQCIDSTVSGHDGSFSLAVSQDAPEPTVSAARLNHRGKAKLTGVGGSPVVVKLEPPVRVEGVVKDPAGRAIAARVTVREINGNEEERFDSGPDGRFELDLPEGLWMFITRLSATGQTVKVVPPKVFVTLGAPPGTCAVTITVTEPVGDAWLVPGEPERVPLEQLDDDALYEGAVALDLPLPNRPTRSAGLQCGVYTLITTDSSGVRRERVDVRASEASYLLPPGPPAPETAAAAQP